MMIVASPTLPSNVWDPTPVQVTGWPPEVRPVPGSPSVTVCEPPKLTSERVPLALLRFVVSKTEGLVSGLLPVRPSSDTLAEFVAGGGGGGGGGIKISGDDGDP